MPLTRRSFVKNGSLAAAALPLGSLALAESSSKAAGSPAPASVTPRGSAESGRAVLRWLEGIPAEQPGATLGVPWPRGSVPAGSSFAIRDSAGVSKHRHGG